jgi:hypothetical protein
MSGVLGQTVQSVNQPDRYHSDSYEENGDCSFFNSDSLDSCAGPRRMGDYKSIESVFSCHFGGAPVVCRVNTGASGSNRKAQTRQKAICANYGKSFVLITLKICSGWIETSRSSEVKSIRPVLQRV